MPKHAFLIKRQEECKEPVKLLRPSMRAAPKSMAAAPGDSPSYKNFRQAAALMAVERSAVHEMRRWWDVQQSGCLHQSFGTASSGWGLLQDQAEGPSHQT
jgi:hypothetical protein